MFLWEETTFPRAVFGDQISMCQKLFPVDLVRVFRLFYVCLRPLLQPGVRRLFSLFLQPALLTTLCPVSCLWPFLAAFYVSSNTSFLAWALNTLFCKSRASWRATCKHLNPVLRTKEETPWPSWPRSLSLGSPVCQRHQTLSNVTFLLQALPGPSLKSGHFVSIPPPHEVSSKHCFFLTRLWDC